jgi:formylglycine-generating enzyme required for sulfatase activity
VLPRLPAPLLAELRADLVERSENPEADLRHRIACGFALGDIGDPRFERRDGPHGEYLMPPLVEIPGGRYPIGDDDPIEWSWTGASDTATGHVPRHVVEVGGFQIGRFPVTNSEWACFVVAGGYDEERWWDTEASRAWRRGELANEGARSNSRTWRKRFLADANRLEQMVEEGRFSSEEAVERWRGWMELDEVGFEAAMEAHWSPKRETEPQYWLDARFNRPTQPVVGVCWYEARAYCAWLAAQSGLNVRLPTEVEWEAAARGLGARAYAYGDAFDVLAANTQETHAKQTTPVGVFPNGRTPEGVDDLSGNVYEWTSSLFGARETDDVETEYPYPYDPADGREDANAGPTVCRVVRGGGWLDPPLSPRAAFRRFSSLPDSRYNDNGCRVVVSASSLT